MSHYKHGRDGNRTLHSFLNNLNQHTDSQLTLISINNTQTFHSGHQDASIKLMLATGGIDANNYQLIVCCVDIAEP